MIAPLEPSPEPVSIPGAELVVKVMMDHYLHTDNLVWRRIPYLFAINAGAWSSIYLLGSASPSRWQLATMVGMVAIVFTCLLGGTVYGAMKNRDVNLPLIDTLLRKCVGPEVLNEMQRHAGLKGSDHLLLLAVPKKMRNWVHWLAPARWFFLMAFGVSITIDVVLIVFVLKGW